MCEGIWGGYLDIYGANEAAPLRLVDGRPRRDAPLVQVRPKPRPEQKPFRKLPLRLAMVQG